MWLGIVRNPHFMKLIYEYRTKLRLIKSTMNVEDNFIQDTICDGQEVLKYINNITTKISKGEYEEPVKISSVQWIPKGEESNASLYSSIETDFHIDLKDI